MQNNSESSLKRFLQDITQPDCIIQAGAANNVDVFLTLENYEAYLMKNQDKDIYFLPGVSPDVGLVRAGDIDIAAKGHFFLDFDVRKQSKERDAEVSDSDIKEIGMGIAYSLREHPILSQWSYLVFSGNGIHLHFVGEPILHASPDMWRMGMRELLKEAEETGWKPDYGCTNIARICRLPGSCNCKGERRILVEILEHQGKRCDMNAVLQRGEDTLRASEQDTAKMEMQNISVNVIDAEDTYAAIQRIPIAPLACNLFGWDTDGYHFWKPGETKHKACFVREGKNYLIHGGTDHLPSVRIGFSPFQLVETKLELDNAGVFQWFKENFPEIAAISKRNKRKVQASTKDKKIDETPANEVPLQNTETAVTFNVAKVPLPSVPVTFGEWHNTVSQNFPELLVAAEASVSVTAQLLIKDITNCFALVLVDVPSSGKTITINFYDEIEGITYSSDTFTPASFVSNATNVKKEELKDIDLLPRIRRKVFLVRDLATIFSARDDDLLKNMGILTRVLDGEGFSTDSGCHGRRALRGDYVFMLFAATTPIPPKVWKTMGTLGQRIFFLSLHSKDKTEKELSSQLLESAYKEKELYCRSVTKDFLYTLWNKYPDGVTWNKGGDSEKHTLVIARCAKLLARLRGQVQVYKENWEGSDKQEIGHTVPIVEKPDRINQCLYNFARGHALVMGRKNIGAEDMRLVISLAFDSAPGHRARLFQELLRRGGEMKTGEIETFLHCSNPTALKEMATLCILGICEDMEDMKDDKEKFDPSKCIRLRDDLKWFLSEECQKYLHPNTVSESLKGDTSKEI